MKTNKRILIVGAGLAGSVIARELAEYGCYVDIIDSRLHIGGNCYDELDPESNIRVHKYGPHIFHTNNKRVFDYLSKFTRWINYRHKVQAYVDGVGFLPFPINIETINRLYNKKLSVREEMEQFLDSIKTHHKQADNARLYAENLYGKDLVELFFSRYTRKMWDIDLAQLPASIVARLPVRYDEQDEYFNDHYQAMPEQGYLSLFKNMLDHEWITIKLGCLFEQQMEKDYFHIFNSMSIDDYYKNKFGALDYRSIKYKTLKKNSHTQPVPTINLTDNSPVTRYTDWRLYPGCDLRDRDTKSSAVIITEELPCSYSDNNFERYYPVKTVDGKFTRRYKQYQKLSEENNKSTFIGRCGQYRYLDMHQVVANSLKIVRDFITYKMEG